MKYIDIDESSIENRNESTLTMCELFFVAFVWNVSHRLLLVLIKYKVRESYLFCVELIKFMQKL